jgi:uncharacterized protein (TIGR02217 family)
VSFFEIEFPRTISYRAVGGPGFSTTVNEGLSGGESRNRNWAKVRREWIVSLKTPVGLDRLTFVEMLRSFHLNVGGKADAFRIKDHLEFKAVGQPLVTVTGGVQLAVTHTTGSRSYVQLIYKPITSAVQDYLGNSLADTVFLHGSTTPVTVDETTGLVTGLAAGTLVDFEYHFPARFDVDKLQLQVEESFVSGGQPIVSWNSIPVIEVQPPNF